MFGRISDFLKVASTDLKKDGRHWNLIITKRRNLIPRAFFLFLTISDGKSPGDEVVNGEIRILNENCLELI